MQEPKESQLSNAPDMRLEQALIYFCAALISLIIGMTAFALFESRNSLEENARREVRSFAEAVGRNAENIFRVTDALLLEIASAAGPLLERDSPLPSSLIEKVRGVPNLYPDINRISILDDQAEVVTTSRGSFAAGQSFRHRRYFQVHTDSADHGLFVGEPILGQKSGNLVVPLSRRVVDEEGNFKGVVLATIGPGFFTDLANEIDLGPKSAILLAHENGIVVARHPANEYVGKSFASRPLFAKHIRESTSGSYVSPEQSDGEIRITGYQYLQKFGVVVAIAIHRDTALRPWFRELYFGAGAVFVLTVFIVIFGIVLKNRASREERLRDTLIEGQETLLRYAGQQRVISALSQSAQNFISADALLLKAKNLMGEYLESDIIFIISINKNSKYIRFFSISGLNEKNKGAESIRLFIQNSHEELQKIDGPIFIKDIKSERNLPTAPLLRELDMRSGITVVVKGFDDQCLVFGAYSSEANVTSIDDAVFLQSVACSVSNYFSTVQNIKLREEVLNSIGANICVLNTEGQIILVNDGWNDFAGSNGIDRRFDWRTVNYIEVCEADQFDPQAKEMATGIREVIKGHTDRFSMRYPCHSPDEERWFLGVVSPVTVGLERGAVVMHMDISERVQAQAELERLKERLETLVREAKVGIMVHVDFKPMIANQQLAKIFGYDRPEDVLELDDIRVLFAETEVERINDYYQGRISSGEAPEMYSLRGVKRDGTEIILENRAFKIDWESDKAVCAMLTDVTEQRGLEEQLRGAQRLEAIGQLTGGIAHDFNNLLTVVLGNAHLMRDRLKEDKALYHLADTTFRAAQRGAELTKRLLAFGRRQPLSPKVIDVNKTVSEVISLLKQSIGEDIEISVKSVEDAWPVYADESQLISAILNLCVNARDAMPSGGILTIETANAVIDEFYAQMHPGAEPGPYVSVSVTDDGCGMHKNVIERAFEPFFTTKEVGEGSGLGLSMVFGFVKQSHGHIRIYSELGVGTTVRVYLPKSKAGSEDVAEIEKSANTVHHRIKRVLVVEDDDMVRDHVVLQMIELGFEVDAASNGREALTLLKAHSDYDLMLADIVMPGGMDGVEMAEEALSYNPNLPVLFASGYSRAATVKRGHLNPETNLIQKPFTIRELEEKIRMIVGEN